MADGYLRHSKYLAQYHLKTKEERIEAFLKAEIDLAIDEIEKEKAKSKALRIEKSEFKKLQDRVDELQEESVRTQTLSIRKMQKQIKELQSK